MAERTLLLVTTVDVGEGHTASVCVYEGDQLQAVAERFCAEFSLPASVVAPLIEHLQENLPTAEQVLLLTCCGC